MGICGIPVLASDYGPYKTYMEKGGQILTAGSEQEWVERLTQLIEDPKFRKRLAQANLEHIKTNEVITKKVSAWETAFTALILA